MPYRKGPKVICFTPQAIRQDASQHIQLFVAQPRRRSLYGVQQGKEMYRLDSGNEWACF